MSTRCSRVLLATIRRPLKSSLPKYRATTTPAPQATCSSVPEDWIPLRIRSMARGMAIANSTMRMASPWVAAKRLG